MGHETRVKSIPAADFGQPEEHIRRLCNTVNGLLEGQGNNHFVVTLNLDSVTTRVIAHSASKLSAVQLSPMSASAAASMAAGFVYALPEQGGIVVHHDSSSTTDRVFGVALNG